MISFAFRASASAGAVLPGAISQAFAETPPSENWRIFEVTHRVEVAKPSGVTRAWVPTPLAWDTRYQKSLGNEYKAEGGTCGMATDWASGTRIVWAEWPAGVAPVLVHTQHFATRDVAVDFSKGGHAPDENPAMLARYTEATEHVPTTGIVKDMSDGIVKGAGTDIEKARAIYEWICDNTYRDPKTRGCGKGDINFMLENKSWGGKCADLNALFVGLARAEGIPARDVYGIRVADSALGYKSLGAGGDITKAQHCRAEFFTAGYGWMPVDPADVRKVILEEAADTKPRRSHGARRAEAPLRLLGDELARLQHRPRRRAAGRHAGQGPVPHVPAGRDRERPPRPARLRQLQVHDQLQGARLIEPARRAAAALVFAAAASALADEDPIRAWGSKPTPPLATHDARRAQREPERPPRARGARELLGHVVRPVPRGAALAREAASRSSRAGPSRFVAVNDGESEGTIQRYLARAKLDVPVWIGPGNSAGTGWNVQGLPMTFLVDAKGQVRYWVYGERNWTEGESLQADRDAPRRSAPCLMPSPCSTASSIASSATRATNASA